MAKKTPKQERATLTDNVQKQTHPIYDVKSKGVTVEWTDNFLDACSAFKDASAPATVHKISAMGHGQCVLRKHECVQR